MTDPSFTLGLDARDSFESGAAKGADLGRGSSISMQDLALAGGVVAVPLLIILSRRSKPARWALRSLSWFYVSRVFRAARSEAKDSGSNVLKTAVSIGASQAAYGAGLLKGTFVDRFAK